MRRLGGLREPLGAPGEPPGASGSPSGASGGLRVPLRSLQEPLGTPGERLRASQRPGTRGPKTRGFWAGQPENTVIYAISRPLGAEKGPKTWGFWAWQPENTVIYGIPAPIRPKNPGFLGLEARKHRALRDFAPAGGRKRPKRRGFRPWQPENTVIYGAPAPNWPKTSGFWAWQPENSVSYGCFPGSTPGP